MAIVSFMLQEVLGVHPTTGDRYPILSLMFEYDDVNPAWFDQTANLFVQSYSAPVVGSPATERWRLLGYNNYSGMGKIEWRVDVSTFDPLPPYTSNADGQFEVRIEGRVYTNLENYTQTPPTAAPNPCPPPRNGFNMNNVSGVHGWSWKIGRMICVYGDDSGSYCRETISTGGGGGGGGIIPPSGIDPDPPDPTLECPPAGPGGSTFDGSPVGVRRVRRGGASAGYVAVAGGGVPAAGADPVDAQTLSAMTRPLVSVDITLNDATVLSRAKLNIPRKGAQASLTGVARFGDVPLPLSDRFGNLPSQTWEVDVADPDGELRGILDGQGVNSYYKKWIGEIFAEDQAERLLGTERRTCGYGRCVTVRTDEEHVVTVVLSDEFSRHDSLYSLDRELPHVRMRDVFSKLTHANVSGATLTATMDCPEEMAAKGLPIILGEASDEWLNAIGQTPIGICKANYVGDFRINGAIWNGYAICLYATKAFPAIFGSDLHPDCPASVRLDPSSTSGTSKFLAPNSGWPWPFDTTYIEFTHKGRTFWVTMIFGSGPISQQHVDGKVPISVNHNGPDDVGDSSGLMIDDGGYLVQLLLDHPIFRGTTSGVWGALAAFPNGVPIVRSSSFAAVVAEHCRRIVWSGSSSTSLGSEDLTNGNFALNPATTVDSWPNGDFTGTGWSWDGSKAVHTPGTAGVLRAQSFTFPEDKRLVFDLSGCTAGTLTVNWQGGATTVYGPADNGTITVDLPYGGDFSSAIKFDASSAFDGSIDNVSSKSIIVTDTTICGYRNAIIIDEVKSARQWLADLLVSTDIRLGINHRGQVYATTLRPTMALTGLKQFTEQHIKEKTFRLTSEMNSELENSLPYEGGPEPASGRVTVGLDTLPAAQSQANWGDIYRAQQLLFVATYFPEVAQSVASFRLAVTANGLTKGEFVTDLRGGDVDGGELFNATHRAGLGTTGWFRRLLLAANRVLHLDEDELSTTVGWEDRQLSLVAPAGLVGGGITSDGLTTSRIGFSPMGDNGGGTGWQMGDAAAGTAWRMG